jgi:hypothetical protein
MPSTRRSVSLLKVGSPEAASAMDHGGEGNSSTARHVCTSWDSTNEPMSGNKMTDAAGVVADKLFHREKLIDHDNGLI